MSKVLVVGANGFLGRHLLALLRARGVDVTATFHQGVEHIPSDCPRVQAAEMAALGDAFETIYITSAWIPYGRMDVPDERLVSVNIELQTTITRAFPRARIVFASSVAVYGSQSRTVDESSPFQSPSLYGLSKLAGECVVRNHPSFAILRFSSLYGDGMNRSTFIPRMIEAARCRGEITLFGDGTRRQDYLHVNDAAGFMIAAAAAGNGVYLGVYGEARSNAEIAAIVAEALPGTKVRHDGLDATPSSVYDNSWTTQQVGYKPSIAPEYGVRSLVNAN